MTPEQRAETVDLRDAVSPYEPGIDLEAARRVIADAIRAAEDDWRKRLDRELQIRTDHACEWNAKVNRLQAVIDEAEQMLRDAGVSYEGTLLEQLRKLIDDYKTS